MNARSIKEESERGWERTAKADFFADPDKGPILNTFDKPDPPDLKSRLASNPASGPSRTPESFTLNALPDPLLVFDTAEIIVFANASATAWLTGRGFPPSGGTGSNLPQLQSFSTPLRRNSLTTEQLPVARCAPRRNGRSN